jgi:hypothetical protein
VRKLRSHQYKNDSKKDVACYGSVAVSLGELLVHAATVQFQAARIVCYAQALHTFKLLVRVVRQTQNMEKQQSNHSALNEKKR